MHSLLYSCSCVLGYGQTGPVFQRGGYDSVAAAVSGLMHITGPEVLNFIANLIKSFSDALKLCAIYNKVAYRNK